MNRKPRFSARHSLEPVDVEIVVRNDAPLSLRHALVSIAYECDFRPKSLRALVCRVLREREDPSNWSEYPNIDGEVRYHLDGCEWYEVYNIIEAIYAELAGPRSVMRSSETVARFTDEVNRFMQMKGIGWQLVDGEILARGQAAFEQELKTAERLLADTGRATACGELREARLDLSRRPQADITGAIQHAVAALECVARDLSGGDETLGELLKRNPGLIPKPLDKVVIGIWGFASERGRHLHEGRAPDFSEAELLVATTASVVNFLIGKQRCLGRD